MLLHVGLSSVMLSMVLGVDCFRAAEGTGGGMTPEPWTAP